MHRSGFAQARLAPLRALARHRWLPLLLALIACLPAIGHWHVLDDHVLRLAATGDGTLVPRATGIDLFEFASADDGRNQQLMRRGLLLPWWSDPALTIRFFRPLSSLTHRLDFALWPERNASMLAINLLWLGLTLWLAARLYARVELARPRTALLATWLYALNDAHGALVGWLSNRNALLSSAGVLGCLLAHQSARERGRRWPLLAPACLGFALFSGELGASAWAWLMADAFALDTRPRAQRVAGLLPHALVTLGWGLAQLASGARSVASGVYLHPLAEPLAFASALPARAAILWGAAFGPLPADLSFLRAAGFTPVLAVGLCAACLASLYGLLRGSGDRALRFWCLAAALGVLPVAASFPSDRLLVLVNVAAMAIVSRALLRVWEAGPQRSRVSAAVAALLFGTHALLAPALLPWRASRMQALGAQLASAFACLDRLPRLEDKTLIVLGAPFDFFVSYLQAERAARGLPRPAQVYWVSNPEAALGVRASGARDLELSREGGFFVTPPESLYRSSPLVAGQRFELPELSAQVLELTESGAVGRIRLRLAEPLGSERYVFLAWSSTGYERLAPESLVSLELPRAASILELSRNAAER